MQLPTIGLIRTRDELQALAPNTPSTVAVASPGTTPRDETGGEPVIRITVVVQTECPHCAEAGSKGRHKRARDWKAVQLKEEHPDWTHDAIAQSLGIALRTLYRYPRYMAACGAVAKRGPIHRGFRTDDGGVEAFAEDE